MVVEDITETNVLNANIGKMTVRLSIVVDAMNAQGVAKEAVQSVAQMMMTKTINAREASVVGVNQLDAAGVGHLRTMVQQIKMGLLKEEAIIDTLADVVAIIGVTRGRLARRKSSAMRHMNYTRRKSGRSRLKLRRLPPLNFKASMSCPSQERSALKTFQTLSESLSFKTFHYPSLKRISCSTSSVFWRA